MSRLLKGMIGRRKGALLLLFGILITTLSFVSCSRESWLGPDNQISRVYTESLESTVAIRIVGDFTGDEEPSRKEEGEGSGFVWDSEGHIVTSAHVVSSADVNGGHFTVERISVMFPDGLDFDAIVVGIDEISDLAVLKVDAPREKFKPVRLGDSDGLKVGQIIVAVGNPFGFDFSASAGIVSGVNRTLYASSGELPIPGGVIQTDASLNPGNSGGPLLDIEGRVMGIAEQVYRGSGVGFAVPINTARFIVPDLIGKGFHDYPWVGVRYIFIETPWAAEEAGYAADMRGIVIKEVVKGSPAEKAGLLPQDIIAALDGEPVVGHGGLSARVLLRNPGDKVTFDIMREGEAARVEVTLGKYQKGVFARESKDPEP